MNQSETRLPNPGEIQQLRLLVRQGESLHLEFKRRASSPDQIVREMIAFANTAGGILLVGINDDGELSGVKYPEEESLVIRKALKKYCRPFLRFEETLIPLTGNKFVIQYEIPLSRKRPHVFLESRKKIYTYIRVKDMSMKATAEMSEIVRRSKAGKNIQFTYGEAEAKLMKHLEQQKTTTVAGFQVISGLTYREAADTLVTLVLANVLKITPTEKGDFYSRV